MDQAILQRRFLTIFTCLLAFFCLSNIDFGAASQICELGSTPYPYKPVGECLNSDAEEVIVWSHVQTNRCCRNTLEFISQALAVSASKNQTIFLEKDQWDYCSSNLSIQGNASIPSCNFANLYQGNNRCSTLNISSIKSASIWESCSSFNTAAFGDQCSNCTKAITQAINTIIDELHVQNDPIEVETCSIATVIAIAAKGIANSAWVTQFYNCLSALDTQDKGNHEKGGLVSVVLLLAFASLVLLIILIISVTKKSSKQPAKGKFSTWSGLYQFSKAEIEKAMNYRNNKIFLGSGSAGRVYQGVLPSGQLVAIKQIYETAVSDSFTRELEGLSRIRHPNLVSLVGFCDDDDEQYLVYDYCLNGNLAQNLSGSDRVLTWDDRVRILKDSAFALSFLHNYPDGCIVHRDVKLTNILLSEKMEAKLSDLGLARMLGMEETKVYTDVKGTIGYLDPEYLTNGKLTCSSDIYSFGIVILQLLSGRKVVELDIDARETLTRRARDVNSKKRPLQDFVDPRLKGDLDMGVFASILQTAVLCVSSSEGRPTINDVVKEMKKAWENTEKHMSPVTGQVAPASRHQSPDADSKVIDVLELN